MTDFSSICVSLKLFFSDSDCESEENILLDYVDEKKNNLDFISKATSKKWYVLALYSMTSFCQVIVWNTWSPIAKSALYAFPTWRESTIALLNNWGSITFLFFIAPCCWLLKEKGLRTSFVLSSFLCMSGSGIRLLTTKEELFTLFAHFGAILNSIGGVILSPAIVQLSSTWFQPNQRTSATGIGTSLSLLGIAGSYLIGPFVVNEPSAFEDKLQLSSGRTLIRQQILQYLIMCFAMELLLFLLILFTFPDKPKVPASRSSILRMTQESPFLKAIKGTLSNLEFWKLSLANGLCSGISGPWLSLLTIIFAQTGISQKETAQLGFWTIICSCLMGLSVSKASDLRPGHIKTILIVLMAFSDFMFIWILLLTTRTLEFNKGTFSIVVIGGLSVLWASPALYYELAAEVNYPISEEITAGCMMAISNFCTCLIYAELYIFPRANVGWMNYCMVVFGLIALFLLIYVKGNYKRLVLDVGKH
ncbi:disrupted in renal carcinoma protein 2 homolog [Cimex lectularius]|uniref:Uncharacterized protein n=1 Tax=Cimex lectularius TaxID=79782 RepID=A0A8I6RFK2_CIMLE|nr:disrupted in renal carcinoma protein 2 homolog [Cimex lectularius]